jgi:recombination protein RecR
MKHLPRSIEQLIESLRMLPTVGQKTAERLAFFLLKAEDENRVNLGQAVLNLKEGLAYCQDCFNFAEDEKCSICQSPKRRSKQICVIEDWMDLLTIENSGVYQGLYHVLGGVISPLEGVGPRQLNIASLKSRLEASNFQEIIIATNPSFEGEATAVHLAELFKDYQDLKITRLARGMPSGGDLEYTDDNTLLRAFEGRGIF